METWAVLVLTLVAGLAVGYAVHMHVAARRPVPPPAPNVVPFPYVVPSSSTQTATPPPALAVSLDYGKGKQVTLTVPRRTARLFYDGRAWDHVSTASGVWTYVPVDADTPRQAQRRALADG